MDRRERAGQSSTALLAALQGLQSGICTAMPGYLVDRPSADGGDELPSFDPVERTVSIQPTIQARVQKPDGTWEWTTLPLLINCPVVFPSGGGMWLTFPLKAGDECLVVFSMRCIDAWWQSGGIQNQPELRMHDWSDGFCVAGVSSVPNVIADISTTAVELRNNARTAFISIDPEAESAEMTFPGGLTINAAAGLTINADITHNGTQTTSEDVVASGISLNSHIHGGVTAGPDETGGPE